MIDIKFDDCLHGLAQLPDNHLDCIITSPPYKDKDGYSNNLILDFLALAYDKLKDNCLMFINFGHLKEDKTRPFTVAINAELNSFKLQETFIWVKNHYKPIQGSRTVNNLTEFIFMFSKGKMPKIDRLAVGIPYKDKSNIGRYSEKDLKCAGNIWNIPYETIKRSSQKLHTDRFPLGLPLNCLKLAGAEPSWLVCDPFSGSGTTAIACKKLGLNFIGWELDQKYHQISLDRLTAWKE